MEDKHSCRQAGTHHLLLFEEYLPMGKTTAKFFQKGRIFQKELKVIGLINYVIVLVKAVNKKYFLCLH